VERYALTAQISFDLIMDDDMSFIEGSYQLPGYPWQVFIFHKEDDIHKPTSQFGGWRSGVTGLHIKVPRDTRLNAGMAIELLTEILDWTTWITVPGPDSLVLRAGHTQTGPFLIESATPDAWRLRESPVARSDASRA
jgi:hypothetical protein